MNEIKIFLQKYQNGMSRSSFCKSSCMDKKYIELKLQEMYLFFLPSQNRKNYSKLSGIRLMRSLIDNVII